MSSGIRDFFQWLKEVWTEWRKVPSGIMLILGLAARTIPRFERLPIYPYIPKLLIIIVLFFMFWALFSVYRKQLKIIESLTAARPLSQMALIELQKLLDEIQHNDSEMRKNLLPFAWRDEAWSFVREGSLGLPNGLRNKIAAYYTEVRSGKEAYQAGRTNHERNQLTEPRRDKARELAAEIIPELQTVISVHHNDG